MSGVVYLEREEGGAVVSLRDGVPVFIEDLGGGDPLGDSMLAQEVITPDQYTQIMEQALSDLTGSEDVAFADTAIALGVLTQGQVDAELQRRVRGQLIQALAWDSARIEIDEDPDGLTGPEYPQAIGPLLYMAVRTFFDEQRIAQLLGEHRDIFLRLVHPRAEVADDLGLDDAERQLLEALDQSSSVRVAADRLAIDSLEAHQLVAMLVLGEHAEHASRPWSSPVENPSQPRTLRSPALMGRYVATEALPEERLGPIARPRPTGTRPATPDRPQPRVATSQDDYAFFAPPEHATERAPSAPQRAPSAPQRAPSAPQRAPSAPQRAPSTPQRAPSTPQRAPSAPQARLQPSSTPAAHRAEPAVSSPVRPPDARPRRLGAALKRLGKELEERRTHVHQMPAENENASGSASRTAAATAATGAAPSSPGSTATAASASAAEQNAVRELIRRRRATVSQQTRVGSSDKKGPAVNPIELMRSAQDALRDQQFGRAHELLTRACEADPSNDIYKMYRLLAAFRANTLPEGELAAFKALVRDKLNDDLQKGFASYAMGHLMLAEKKDESAEKFFRKARELDKHNKDAERHVRLLELRKKSAASDTSNNKIFGIEIGGPKKG